MASQQIQKLDFSLKSSHVAVVVTKFFIEEIVMNSILLP